jgi:hypothetical protein
MSKAGTGLSITSKCSQVKTRFVGEVHAVAWRLRRGPARPPLFLYKITIGDSDLINVCFGPFCGLKSDILRGPRRAITGPYAAMLYRLADVHLQP